MAPGRYRPGRGYGIPLVAKLEVLRRRSAGESWAQISEAVGVGSSSIGVIVQQAGGMPPRRTGRPQGQLSLAEREEIMIALAADRGVSFQVIADTLGKDRSTIWREVCRNGGRRGYKAWAAERRADERARRPQPGKLESNEKLAAEVESGLRRRLSPEQISNRLLIDFPGNEEMRVSDETIYKTLFVQGRGGLNKELVANLRSGRAVRRPRGRATKAGPGKLSDRVMISERPAEVADRAVPGHWEGDLLLGADCKSAIGTLVERTTWMVMLLHLPGHDHTAATVRDAMTTEIVKLPEWFRLSITWDQGKEMAQHVAFTIDTGIQIYFCDPHSPWQRPTNENTNGLLRQYFPKGTDLSVYPRSYLDFVADELNNRPRRKLDWLTPLEAYQKLLSR
jgi:transposase, IS30 family